MYKKVLSAAALCLGTVIAATTAASACFNVDGPAGGCYQTTYTYCSYNADGTNCCYLAHVTIKKITAQDC